ncbi:MAG TPA: hypothetical protein VIB47_07740 [Dehalococcoidia bacterium]|jgi:hypothetical protein
MRALRLRVVLLGLAVVLAATGCVRAGEIDVYNAGSETVLVSPYSLECDPSSDAATKRAWYVVEPGQHQKVLVVSGGWFGSPCLTVSDLGGVVTLALTVERGRQYEVTQPQAGAIGVRDAGEHDQPWYYDMSWSASSPLLWMTLAIYLAGAPFGLYITVRYFYRYYVRHQG